MSPLKCGAGEARMGPGACSLPTGTWIPVDLGHLQLKEHKGQRQPSAVLQLTRSRRPCSHGHVPPVLLPAPPGWTELFCLQKPYQQHTRVICQSRQQQNESVAFPSARYLHHFPPVSFLCYFVLFPHRSHLNNFQAHTEVESF